MTGRGVTLNLFPKWLAGIPKFILNCLALYMLTVGVAQSGSTNARSVLWLDITESGVRISDYDQGLEVLQRLGALPKGDAPTVVSVQTIDLQNQYMAGLITSSQELISAEAASFQGETPILVLTPWGRPHEVVERGGRFPASLEELVELGFGDVAALEDVVMVWDPDATFPELVAPRSYVSGGERLDGVHMYLCATSDEILGWSRPLSYQSHRVAADATVGRFARDCLQGKIAMPREYRVPRAALEELGVADGWFAVLLPDAYSQAVPLEATVSSAREVLALANVEIPLFIKVVDTVTAGWTEFVPASRHALALSDQGIVADERSASLPDWIGDFKTSSGNILVLFDDSGTAVAHFGATATNPTGRNSMVEVLMMKGLF